MVRKLLEKPIPSGRFWLVALVLITLPLMLIAKIAQLQVFPDAAKGGAFLRDQGDSRAIRQQVIPAYRGVIADRNGEPLALSIPVTTLITDPKRLQSAASQEQLEVLASALNISVTALHDKLARYRKKSFMVLSKQLPVEEAEAVLALRIPGVSSRKDYKRFYPAGEVTAQLVGITDKDDAGQEGVELAYDAWLSGELGNRKILQDETGRVIKDLSLIKAAKPGRELRLSIDLRVQYAAYRALKGAVQKHGAKSGSVVVLDVASGEVLAMANQPSFNPNDRSAFKPGAIRNRAMLDLIEPGSTVKPFTILAALQSGLFDLDSEVDTSPGYLKVDYKTFVDADDYGRLNLAQILAKSSQVGTTKIALQLDPEKTRQLFEKIGLGESTGSGFPAEAVGNLPAHTTWDAVTQATFAFGYGFNVTSLQLARAYAVLANNGVRREVSLMANDERFTGAHLFDPRLVETVRGMLQIATSSQGTGSKAMIEGYTVAGKTGTLHKVKAGGGYAKDRYTATFAGLAPATHPRLVTVVVIDEPARGNYFGGLVAAPVFSEVTSNALRLLQVPPDSDGTQSALLSRLMAVEKKSES